MNTSNNKKIKKYKNKLILLAVVIIPWLVILFYVVFLAQDRFVSTSSVVVKQVSEATTPTAGGLGAVFGLNNVSGEDARYLKKYILSHDMINKLDKRFNLRKAYSDHGRDIIYGLPTDASKEELSTYFKKHVSVELDEQSHILSIKTEGFSPEFARSLNQAIISESEVFINTISRDVAKDQLVFAKEQLEESKSKLNSIKKELLDYQNTNQVIDPQANVTALSGLIATLEANLSTLRTEERTLLSYLQPTSPQVLSIQSQITALEAQIEQEKSKLTSPGQNKLNKKAVQFESIKAEVEFATDLYKLSLSALEKARLEAVRKMKNLIVITSPQLAEEALYPRKAYVLTTSLILLLMLYGFVSMVLSVIKDHRD